MRELLLIAVLGEAALILPLVALLLWNPERPLETWANAVNRASGLRELETALSRHAYVAELLQEYLERGWTSKNDIHDLLTDYNQSIAQVRSLEARSLRPEDSALADAFKAAREFDRQLGALKDELVAVNVQETKDHADADKAAKTAQQLLPLIKQFKSQISQLPTKG